MIRRLLLIVVLAGTPVAQVRAEFLFADPASTAADSGDAAWTSRASQPEPKPLSSDQDQDSRGGFLSKPAGMDSSGTSQVTSGSSAGALLVPAARISDGGLVSSLFCENGCRYQQPSLAGLLRPPQTAC